MNTQEIIDLLKDKLPLLKKYHISQLALFGSHSTGTATAESDLDLLVDFEDGQDTFDNYMDLKLSLEDSFHCKVDLVITSTVKPALKDAILGSAIYVKGA